MLSTLFHAIALHIALVTFYFSPSLHIFLPQYPQILLYCSHFHSHHNVAKLRISLFFLLMSWDFIILLITSLCPSFPGHNKLSKSNSISLLLADFLRIQFLYLHPTYFTPRTELCASSRSQPPRHVACSNLPWWKSPVPQPVLAHRSVNSTTKQSFWSLSPLL